MNQLFWMNLRTLFVSNDQPNMTTLTKTHSVHCLCCIIIICFHGCYSWRHRIEAFQKCKSVTSFSPNVWGHCGLLFMLLLLMSLAVVFGNDLYSSSRFSRVFLQKEAALGCFLDASVERGRKRERASEGGDGPDSVTAADCYKVKMGKWLWRTDLKHPPTLCLCFSFSLLIKHFGLMMFWWVFVQTVMFHHLSGY